MQLSGIASQIWDEKYRYKDKHGEPVDQTVEDTFSRIATALAAPEPASKCDHVATEFYDALSDFSIIPAGRIIAGAGTARKVTLQNCFVMGRVPDSLRGIHDMLRDTALTMKEGGGTGTDFSTLRPKGSIIEDLGVGSSGPLAFMDEWDAMCKSIMSAGHRRGAMMGTLRIDHPDIEEFVVAKRDGKRWRNFNVSVLVTDPFMQAVKADADWELRFNDKVYRTVRARDLWHKIMRSTFEFADPGVIFIDRVNAANPLGAQEELICTNPCAEKPLPPWGSCCLGSVNLTRMVIDAFTVRARIDYNKLTHAVATLLRLLDNVIDVTHYPLPQQHEEAMRKRRVGIGITGFADMLAMCGIPYGSTDAVRFVTDVTSYVHEAADEATQKLGEEKGSFAIYDAELYKPLARGSKGAAHRRNSHLTSIAPTGTISLFAGNISSGIEPIFDLELTRKLRQPDDSWKEVTIRDYAYEQWRRDNDGDTLPGSFVTAAQLTPDQHLAILAAAQKWTDSSISKTINCPEAIGFDEFENIYLQAYNMGVKSCTTYRPNKITGSILSSDTMKTSDGSNVVELTKPLVRPAALPGLTYRLKPKNTEHALFITINDIEENGRRRPFEIFINSKNLESAAWLTALTRMISAIFRKGGEVAFVVDELLAVYDPHGGGYWEDQKYVPSVVAGIGKVIQRHLESVGVVAIADPTSKKQCPKCQGQMISKEGCWSCNQCTHTACG